MNYYIEGNAAKADQIRAAFKELGYDTGHLGSTSSQLYYTIEGKVELMCTKSLQNLVKTHPDYQELELPVEPKFKVRDEIETGNIIETIAKVNLATRSYYCKSGRTIWFENQDLWHLVPKTHYDIKNFKPFDKVLVRQNDSSTWGVSFFGCYYRMFMCCTNVWFEQCIPFEGNEHLLGTTDMCDEMYINW